MGFKDFKFKVVQGETEHISYSGKRARRSTVLLQVGKHSLSMKAFYLGVALVLCQFFDGLFTYVGLEMQGLHMERNRFLRELMRAYGTAPVLVAAKFVAVVLIVVLTSYAHRRKWIRPVIASLVAVYLVLAVVPWTYIIINGNQSKEDYKIKSKTNSVAGSVKQAAPSLESSH